MIAFLRWTDIEFDWVWLQMFLGKCFFQNIIYLRNLTLNCQNLGAFKEIKWTSSWGQTKTLLMENLLYSIILILTKLFFLWFPSLMNFQAKPFIMLFQHFALIPISLATCLCVLTKKNDFNVPNGELWPTPKHTLFL